MLFRSRSGQRAQLRNRDKTYNVVSFAELQAQYPGYDWAAHLREDGAVMWHHHPDRPWSPHALPIRGWNEAFPVFVLGAGSRSHPIPAADRTGHSGAWKIPASARRQRLGVGLDAALIPHPPSPQ